MKTIYISTSKGKEMEGEFSTRELAEADLNENEYYLGSVVEVQVDDESYQGLILSEGAK